MYLSDFCSSAVFLWRCPPLTNTYCLSISHPTRECWRFRATLPLLSENSIETSSCCHLGQASKPRFQGYGFHPTSIQRAIFFDHISFIAPLTVPSVFSLILYISPGRLVFILWLQSGPGPDWARPDTLTLILIKAIWTAKFSSWLHKLTLSVWRFLCRGVFKGKFRGTVI